MKKVLLFDFAGVIGSESYFGWVKRNIPDFEARRAEFQAVADLGDLGALSVEEFFQKISQVTGLPVASIWPEMYEPVSINEDLIALIRQLKSDYQIVLFSNYMGELLRQILTKRQVIDLFDDIFISSEQKAKKPDVNAFTKVVQNSGVEKQEVLFIDDRLENVQAAQQLGIDALVFTDVAQLRQDLAQYLTVS